MAYKTTRKKVSSTGGSKPERQKKGVHGGSKLSPKMTQYKTTTQRSDGSYTSSNSIGTSAGRTTQSFNSKTGKQKLTTTRRSGGGWTERTTKTLGGKEDSKKLSTHKQSNNKTTEHNTLGIEASVGFLVGIVVFFVLVMMLG